MINIMTARESPPHGVERRCAGCFNVNELPTRMTDSVRRI